MSRPATAGLRKLVTPTVEAWARCAQPNASFTYRSALAATCITTAHALSVNVQSTWTAEQPAHQLIQNGGLEMTWESRLMLLCRRRETS